MPDAQGRDRGKAKRQKNRITVEKWLQGQNSSTPKGVVRNPNAPKRGLFRRKKR